MGNRGEEHQDAVAACALAASLLGTRDLPAIVGAAQRALDTGCFFNPTLWIQKSKALQQDLELLLAALPLWEHAKKVKEAQDAGRRPEG